MSGVAEKQERILAARLHWETRAERRPLQTLAADGRTWLKTERVA